MSRAAPDATQGRTGVRGGGGGPTRISWAWICTIVALVLGIALLDFLVQNTRTIRIEFFTVTATVPTTVALLGAALAGAAVVVIIGILRMAQLRHSLRTGGRASGGPGAGASPLDSAGAARSDHEAADPGRLENLPSSQLPT